jgi:hypothetical protein
MSDTYLTIRQICARLPGSRGAARTNPATITRWILRGIRTPSGLIRLHATRVGSRWLISEAAFAEFLRAATELSLPDPPPTAPVSPREQHRRAEAAARTLKERYQI